MGRALPSAALAAATTLLAAACSGGLGGSSTGSLDVDDLAAASQQQADSSAFASVGTCLAGARQRDNPSALATAMARYGTAAFETVGAYPAWTDPVDCSQPHEIEVYGLVSVPDAVDAEIVSYANVVDVGTRVYRDVDQAVAHACVLSYGPAAKAMASSSLEVDVSPVWAAVEPASLSWAPAPADDWDSGDHSFACLFEQSAGGTVAMADVSAAAFPTRGRICLKETAFVSCARPHDAERFATLRLDQAVADRQIAGAAAVDDLGRIDLGSDVWSQLDGVCQQYLVAAAPHHAASLQGVANTYPEMYPDADGHYTVLCSAQAAFAAEKPVVTSTSVFGPR